MQRAGYRAGSRRPFQYSARFRSHLSWKTYVDYYLADAARIGTHYLGDAQAGPDYVDALRPGRDAHQRHHAAAQCCGYQIGRRESLALSVIVGRRVGQNLAARLHMGRFGAKLAQIDGFYGCHACSVFSWGCRFLRDCGSGRKCFAPERSISGLRVLPMTKIAQLCFFRVMNRPLNCMRMQKNRSVDFASAPCRPACRSRRTRVAESSGGPIRIVRPETALLRP